jgi:hypothetical protein
VDVETFGEWITAPPNYGKYTYSKTVQDLVAPASYRTVVDFRWRSRSGRTIKSARVTSPACKQPDERPDLVVRSVRYEAGAYVATVFNRGREAAGPFAVAFTTDGTSLGTVEVSGLEPHTPAVVRLRSAPCAAPGTLAVLADPHAQIDEAQEDNNALAGAC